MDPRRREPAERSSSGAGSSDSPLDQRPRVRRRQAVERVPTGQEAIADGEASAR